MFWKAASCRGFLKVLEAAEFHFLRDVMVSEAVPVQHSCAFNSQGFTPKHSATVRMQEEHCGFPSRLVNFICLLSIYADIFIVLEYGFMIFESTLWVLSPHTDAVSELYF